MRYTFGMAKILVVEDDPVFLELLTTKFRADGHQVVSAVDAYVAIVAARNFKPDILTLDYDLPAGKGDTVLARMLKERIVTEKTPVIFISGRNLRDCQPPISDGPAVRYFQKPVSLVKLSACVAELLKTASSPSQPARTESGDASPGGAVLDLDS